MDVNSCTSFLLIDGLPSVPDHQEGSLILDAGVDLHYPGFYLACVCSYVCIYISLRVNNLILDKVVGEIAFVLLKRYDDLTGL